MVGEEKPLPQRARQRLLRATQHGKQHEWMFGWIQPPKGRIGILQALQAGTRGIQPRAAHLFQQTEKQTLLLLHSVASEFGSPFAVDELRAKILLLYGSGHALMTTASPIQIPPRSDTSSSFWLMLLFIQLAAAVGRRQEQALHISVLPWR